uniref:Uncharacterized protein n=1 Tax=Arundo donax TaxID=35708 RepID=A0A0A8Z5L4_ARUDO
MSSPRCSKMAMSPRLKYSIFESPGLKISIFESPGLEYILFL